MKKLLFVLLLSVGMFAVALDDPYNDGGDPETEPTQVAAVVK